MMKEEKTSICMVTAVHKERYELAYNGQIIFGRLKPSIYYNEHEGILFPSVGDEVEVILNEMGDSMIKHTLPRKSYFSRKNPTQGMPDQIVAANFDYVFIVMSLNHDFHTTKLDRYLASAWQSGGTPVVILSKADLADTIEHYIDEVREHAPGVDVLVVSVVTGFGMDSLNAYLKKDKKIVFLGSSGVGKSSLINALIGEERMKVNDIRESDSQGRHTTTYRQCFQLKSGAIVMDTPGMRLVQMGCEAEDGIRQTYEDIEMLMKQCKFSNCKHKKETGCSVQEALQDGSLSKKRWDNYLVLQAEERHAKQKAENVARRQTRKKYSKKDRSYTVFEE